jgi:Skp family chaperone for outer membrane proteins
MQRSAPMTRNLETEVTQLSADFKAFQQELKAIDREFQRQRSESDEKFRKQIAESDEKFRKQIAESDAKFNAEMNSLARENTKFARTIIIGAAVVSVISLVIKEIAPFITELIRASVR